MTARGTPMDHRSNRPSFACAVTAGFLWVNLLYLRSVLTLSATVALFSSARQGRVPPLGRWRYGRVHSGSGVCPIQRPSVALEPPIAGVASGGIWPLAA